MGNASTTAIFICFNFDFVYHLLGYRKFYYLILYSFILVLFSIHTINGILIRERKNILKNPIFLICTAFVIYFTFRVLVYTSWMYGLSMSNEFNIKVNFILESMNLFANLIYALAILWMPTKHRFTLQF